jgi:defect-in-organelle-trafficking protein DotD
MARSLKVSLPALGLVLALTGLGGCAHEVPTTVDMPGMPNPELAMRESMAHVEKEMGELGRAGPVLKGGPVVVPGELDKVVAFEWNGPLDGAVKKLAGEVGYTVLIDAPWNAPSVHVGISTGPRRVYDIFEALGAAAGNQATVEVDPQHHRVEVIYHV